MRTKIKIWFVDFFGAFDMRNNFIINTLRNRYDIELNMKNPDYLFCSAFGKQHFKYKNSIKIYWTGEMDEPDFNQYDYAIGSSFLTFADRYVRIPLFVLSNNAQYFNNFSQKTGEIREEYVDRYCNRKFCNFIYTNSKLAHPMREIIFKRLSEYKKVDSGGVFLNNMGGKCVKNKIEFLCDYKFTIAVENSSIPGYTTEKLIDPILAQSMPIYWGNNLVNHNFNTKSFVNLMDYNSIDDAITDIIRLDNDNEAYIQKLQQKCMFEEQIIDYKTILLSFLENIIDKDLFESKRLQPYGYILNVERAKNIIANRFFDNKMGKILMRRYVLSNKWLNNNI